MTDIPSPGPGDIFFEWSEGGSHDDALVANGACHYARVPPWVQVKDSQYAPKRQSGIFSLAKIYPELHVQASNQNKTVDVDGVVALLMPHVTLPYWTDNPTLTKDIYLGIKSTYVPGTGAGHYGEKWRLVAATGFEVDAAWQAHLDAAHKEPPVTATALEAELKPLFRM